MRPPQLSVRIGRFTSRDHGVRCSMLVDRDHLDGKEIVSGQAELSAKKAEGAADHVAADADLRILTEGDDHTPALEEHTERLANGDARFDGERATLWVVIHVLHG